MLANANLLIYQCKLTVGYLCRFAVRVRHRPFYTLELKEKVKDVDRVDEIDECVPHVALRLHF